MIHRRLVAHRITGSLCMVSLVALFACASPPESPQALEEPPMSQEPTPEPVIDRRMSISSDIQAFGLSVTETPEGELKVVLPSEKAFALNQANVSPAFAQLLGQVADVLAAYPDIAVEVVGHTDSSGSREANLSLSLRRATSAANVLVDHGVAHERVSVHGMGPDAPAFDNGTHAGRAANRRIELILMQR